MLRFESVDSMIAEAIDAEATPTCAGVNNLAAIAQKASPRTPVPRLDATTAYEFSRRFLSVDDGRRMATSPQRSDSAAFPSGDDVGSGTPEDRSQLQLADATGHQRLQVGRW